MSNLLEQASLVMIPSGYKEDVVYSEIPLDGSGDLQLTRASNGTRVNSAGLVEVCPWNLVEFSEDFSNAIWVKSRTTITSNATNAPNGTLTADKFIATSASGVHTISQSGFASEAYSFSVYAKAGEETVISLWLRSAAVGATFDLSAGTVSNITVTSATITDVGDGWYRCFVYDSTPGTTANIYGRTGSSYVGNGVDGFFIWGAQLNIGTTAKPYFPTTDRLNVPRLTYQNGGGGCPSLLLEKQSTNLALYSQEFDNAAWTKNNTTISANNQASPDGNTNADTLTGNGVSGFHELRFTTGVSITNGQVLTTSIFAKAGTNNFIQFVGPFAVYNNNNVYANFNISTGVVGDVGAGTTASIVNYGNGWYRCSITATAGTTGTNNPFILNLITSNTAVRGESNSLSTSVYVYGAQLEASSYPTSYIPTTSSSATRVADACFKTGISSLIGQTEGTLFADFYWNGNAIENWLVSVHTSSTNFIAIFLLDDGRPYYYILNSGSPQMAYVGTALSIGRHKMAIGYKQNDSVAYMDGNLLNTDTSCTIPTTTDVGVGYFIDGTVRSALINEAVLFKTRLTNAELASLTTI